MKKFVKWFLFSLVLCGGIALAICYCVMPEQTRLAMDKVIEYLNTPLGLVCGTTITLGLVVFVLVKLVYDRYRNRVGQEINEIRSFNVQKLNETKLTYEKALQVKEEVLQVLHSYDTRIDDLCDKICKVCETSPNAKVKALSEEIKNGYKQVKEEINEQIKNNEFVVEEAPSKIEELENQVKLLTEQVERLVANYGREETTND